MKFFDTHIHLSDFSCRTEDILAEASSCGVNKMINISAKPEDWQTVINLSEKYPENIIPAIGIHPWHVEKNAENLQKMEFFLQKNKKIIIGECGIDRLKPDFEVQTELFVAQAEMAKKHGRPLIIHNVKAYDWFQNNWHKLPEKFVFHSYNGKKEFLKQILNHGGYVGFNASVFKSREAENIIKYVPADRILLETDAPYQGFEKGKENTPETLLNIFAKIVQIRGANREELSAQIYQNSFDFIKY